MCSVTVSQARANLSRFIDRAARLHEPIVIAGKRHSAVLLSLKDWQALQETLHLLSIPGMRQSIRREMDETLSKSAKELRW
jgi:antitoxin YefM